MELKLTSMILVLWATNCFAWHGHTYRHGSYLRYIARRVRKISDDTCDLREKSVALYRKVNTLGARINSLDRKLNRVLEMLETILTGRSLK